MFQWIGRILIIFLLGFTQVAWSIGQVESSAVQKKLVSTQREIATTKKNKKRRKRYKKRVMIDFEDELIGGGASVPSIFHLFHKKQLNYGRLIKFRKNFLPEMRRTVREI